MYVSVASTLLPSIHACMHAHHCSLFKTQKKINFCDRFLHIVEMILFIHLSNSKATHPHSKNDVGIKDVMYVLGVIVCVSLCSILNDGRVTVIAR